VANELIIFEHETISGSHKSACLMQSLSLTL